MRRWLRRGLAVAIALVLIAAATTAVWPRQIRSYLTHWKGSPSSTVAYGPFPVGGEPELLLAVAGDVGDSGSRLTGTADAVAQLDRRHPYDALLLLGDNAYPNGDPDVLPDTVFEPFAPVLDHARLLAVLGNHDVKDGHADAQVEALGLPGRWWSVTLGDVLLVGIDSNAAADEVQRQWLEQTLQESDARWKIVAVHHPPYSAGYQGSSSAARDLVVPLAARHGVQVVLSGHDHDYQRSIPLDGVTYVVSGAAAGTRRTSTDWFTAEAFSWHHFVEIAVFDDALVLRTVNQSLRVADEVVLTDP